MKINIGFYDEYYAYIKDRGIKLYLLENKMNVEGYYKGAFINKKECKNYNVDYVIKELIKCK
jgi:hypothetical protein